MAQYHISVQHLSDQIKMSMIIFFYDFFHFCVFLGGLFALKRHIFSQHTLTTLQPVLKCSQRYAGQSTIG